MTDIDTVDIDSLVDLFGSLSRGDEHAFAHLLTAFGSPVVLDESNTTVRTHFLAVDANGAPATNQLAQAMARFVLDFAIPRKRIVAAMNNYALTNSTEEISQLSSEARELFVRSEDSGEGGELLLFMLMEKTLGYPQLLSKFALKTNTNVHVHGSDGVHGRLNDDGDLDLFWGESKFYASSSAAIRDCFESVAPFLNPEDDSSRKQDLLLLREHLNIDDQEIAAHLIRYFDDTKPESIRVRWNAVCLVGFDLDAYPNAAAALDAELATIEARVKRWHKSLLNRVTENSLISVNIDVFCIPLPSVDKLRKAVNKRLGLT